MSIRRKGDCKAPPGYSSVKGTAPLGRTRLLVGTQSVNEEVPPAPVPAVTPSPIEPFHAPERRKWARQKAKREKDAANPAGAAGARESALPAPPATRALREKQQPTPPAQPGGAEWELVEGGWMHVGCGGRMAGVGTPRPACVDCNAEWYRDRERTWRRF